MLVTSDFKAFKLIILLFPATCIETNCNDPRLILAATKCEIKEIDLIITILVLSSPFKHLLQCFDSTQLTNIIVYFGENLDF